MFGSSQLVPSRHSPSFLPKYCPTPFSLTLVLPVPAGYGEGDALNLSSKSDSRDDLSDAPTPRDDKDEALSDADDLDDKNGKLPTRSTFMPLYCCYLFSSTNNCFYHSPVESLFGGILIRWAFDSLISYYNFIILSVYICCRRCNRFSSATILSAKVSLSPCYQLIFFPLGPR